MSSTCPKCGGREIFRTSNGFCGSCGAQWGKNLRKDVISGFEPDFGVKIAKGPTDQRGFRHRG